MKKKHWLIYVVIFLTIINLGYFISLKYYHLDIFIKNKIVDYLEKKSNLKINYDNLSINDKEITISGLKIEGTNFILKSIQLDFQYKFWRVFFHNKKKPILENIHFYLPQLDVNIKKRTRQNSIELKIPNLENYFSKLQILNAKVNLNYQNENYFFKEQFKEVLLDIDIGKSTKINLNGKLLNKGKIQFEGKFLQSKVDSIHFKITNFHISEQQTNFVEKLNFSADAIYHNKLFDFKISKLNAVYQNHSFKILDEKISGNLKSIKFNFKNLFIDRKKVCVKGEINNLDKVPKMKIDFSTKNIDVSKYYSKINSKINISGKVEGPFNKPEIIGIIKSNQIIYRKYKLQNTELTYEIFNGKIKINLLKSYFMDNKIYGKGKYENRKYSLLLNCDSFYYDNKKFQLNSQINAEISNNTGFGLKVFLNKMKIKYGNISLNKLQTTINLRNNILMAKAFNPDRSILISLSKDLSKNEENVSLIFQRYDLNNLTKNISRLKNFQMPSISGKFTYYKNIGNLLTTNMDLRIYDTEYGRFDGKFKGVYIKDYLHKKNYVRLNSHSAKFNYEPFGINLMAGGDFDNFKTYYFKLNNDIDIKANLKFKPKLTYNVNVKGKNIRINDIAKYFVKNYTSREIGGKLDFDVFYSSENLSKISGKIDVSNFFYDLSQSYNSHLEFVSEKNKIKISDFKINTLNKTICNINGYFIPKNKKYSANVNILKNKLSDIFPNSVFNGKVFGNLHLDGIGKKYAITAKLRSLQSKIHNTKVDTLIIAFSQSNKKFILKKLRISNPYFKIYGKGKIGYNIFSNEMIASKDILSIKAKGDFLEFLSSEIKGLNFGKSQSFASLALMINENGFFVKNGKFEVHNGVANIENQTENIRKFELKSYIENNNFYLKNCKFYVGQGWFKMHNKILNNENDFKIGELNFGQYYFKTSKSGLLVYVNGYMPNKSLINIKLTGKDSKYSTVQGPFDNIKIRSVVEFSNGGAIYPPYTKNILKMLMQNDRETTVDDSYEDNELPLDLDLILRFNENIKYVTYPLNVAIDPNSYLHIIYKNGHFSVPDAKITSEKGKLEMFGTNFEAREIQVLMNPYMRKTIIYGSFTKKVGDGSLVILDISAADKSSDKSKRTFGNLQMHLSSDNPNDSSPERILAKLRYNKNFDELSNTERKNIYQDEAIDWAGVGISNFLIDPLISPIENYVRKLLDLDTFYLKTDIFKNIFYQNFDNSNNDNLSKSNLISNLGLNYFLNDLSVNAGKYIYRDVFLDYELNFQKSNNLDDKSKLDLYHRFVFRVDLPWKIKLSYKYYLKPKDEKNSQELMINRSFHF